MLAEAVDTQFTGLRGMQSATLASGAFTTLLVLAQQGVPDAFECLQRLCFKNPNGCRVIEQQGVGESQGGGTWWRGGAVSGLPSNALILLAWLPHHAPPVACTRAQ